MDQNWYTHGENVCQTMYLRITVPLTAWPGGPHPWHSWETEGLVTHHIFHWWDAFHCPNSCLFFFFFKNSWKELRRQASLFHWPIRSHSYWHSPPLFMLRFPQHYICIEHSVRIHIKYSLIYCCFSAFWQRLGAGCFCSVCVCVCVSLKTKVEISIIFAAVD